MDQSNRSVDGPITLSETCDLLVIGSGAGALCAALTACEAGLSVIMVEKEEKFGGASARAGGGVWIPNTHHAKRYGLKDSYEMADTYFRYETGSRYHPERVKAFLENGPRMIEFVESTSTLTFHLLAEFPDYHCESPGGGMGRSLYPNSWDARELGDELKRLRPVLRAATFLDMQIGVGEVPMYLTASRKLGSFLGVARNLLRRTKDQVTHGRSMRLVSGNALVAGLAAAAFRRGLRLWTASPAKRLFLEDGVVAGAIVQRPEGLVKIRAGSGVILATGGFPHDSERRAKVFAAGRSAPEVWGMLPYGNAGDGIRMGEDAGGVFDDNMSIPIALTPITTLHCGEGRLETNPVFFNRGAPGVISVTPAGQRFVNEARSYHDWGMALLSHYEPGEEAVAHIVCDRRALRRYGLGVIKPGPFPVRKHLRSGFLKTGRTLQELAVNSGIDPEGLMATVSRFNEHAVRGEDPDFGRGSTAYELANGDPDQRPNPCVGPLGNGPFYSIRVFAGCVATFAGLKTDEHAQVLDNNDVPVSHLYAVGNDMASITGGDYISGGCTLGPAMTFGHIAANHVISRTTAIKHPTPGALH